MQNELQALIDEGKSLQALDARDEEQDKRYAALPGMIDAKREEIATEVEQSKRFSSALQTADQFLNGGTLTSVSPLVPRHAGAQGSGDTSEVYQKLRGLRGRSRFFSLVAEESPDRRPAAEKAFRFGMWCLASIKGNRKAIDFCRAEGIPVNGVMASGGHTESINEDGGALVPAEFENDMIILREKFGLFRQWARYTPMSTETKSRPRRTGGLTAYFVGGGADGTRSKAGWDRVQLVAKKVMVLALYESELAEDAMVDIGDTLFGEAAYAMSQLEDSCGLKIGRAHV